MKKTNNEGMVVYYFLIIFFLINFTTGAIINEFFKSTLDEKTHISKEKSRILAESGLEISMSKIYKKESPGYYYFNQDISKIRIKIEQKSEVEFFIESIGSYKNGKTKVEGKITLKDDLYPEVIERKMW